MMPLITFDDLVYRSARFAQLARDAAHVTFGDITSKLLIDRTLLRLVLSDETERHRRLFSQMAPNGDFIVPILRKSRWLS